MEFIDFVETCRRIFPDCCSISVCPPKQNWNKNRGTGESLLYEASIISSDYRTFKAFGESYSALTEVVHHREFKEVS